MKGVSRIPFPLQGSVIFHLHVHEGPHIVATLAFPTPALHLFFHPHHSRFFGPRAVFATILSSPHPCRDPTFFHIVTIARAWCSQWWHRPSVSVFVVRNAPRPMPERTLSTEPLSRPHDLSASAPLTVAFFRLPFLLVAIPFLKSKSVYQAGGLRIPPNTYACDQTSRPDCEIGEKLRRPFHCLLRLPVGCSRTKVLVRFSAEAVDCVMTRFVIQGPRDPTVGFSRCWDILFIKSTVPNRAVEVVLFHSQSLSCVYRCL